MLSRRLRLNPIWLGSKTNLCKVTEHSIDLFGNILLESPTVRSLGVTLDPSVTLIYYISRLSSTCFFKNLWRIRRCISKSLAIQLVHAFITCQLDYSNSIFHGLPAVQAPGGTKFSLVVTMRKSMLKTHLFRF